jgi:hypothetical protein
MRRGDPDTGRGVHRVEQVLAGRAARRQTRSRAAPGAQAEVGITDNGADGHDLLSCIGEWLQAIAGDRGTLGRK